MEEVPMGRLPEAVRPRRYDIHLFLDPDGGRFHGTVLIELNLLRPAASVTLHALGLEVEGARFEQGTRVIEGRLELHPGTETLTVVLPESIPSGDALLSLGFSGRINRQLRGLYEVRAGEEVFAFTQFEATDARRMFPCFDEPGMKARFRLTVDLPSRLTALSNLPVEAERVSGDRKTVVFPETPVMSTYLLALAAARFEVGETRVGDTRVSVWTPPGQVELGRFALKVASGVLPLLNDYFDLPYPLPKLDLVGVPDFAMGAMENWGLIFFRDSRLLLDEAGASAATLRDVANVITHEIVHQWFGNLVTMAWWDDLWLNESFATWLACKIVDEWRPDWNSWTEFQEGKHVPLAIDALTHTRPIQAKASTAAEIEEMFDPLTYEKGAACLRMIEQFVGEAPFREGIRRYIRKYQFQNTVAENLWTELSEATGQPITEMARDWFTQPGFPLVSGRTAPGDGRDLYLDQRRFHAAGGSASPEPQLWTIPFTLRWKDGGGVHRHRQILKERTTSLRLPGDGKVDWIYLNADESGFLRTDYDPDLRARVLSAASKELEASERIGFLNHFWALIQTGTPSIAEFMEALLRFKGDPTRVVVQALGGYLDTLSRQMVLPADQSRFEAVVLDLFSPVWKNLGWDPQPNEGDEGRLSRAAALWAMGALAREEEILSELPRRLMLYWTDPASLDPTLAGTVLRLSARSDGGSLFDRFIQKLESAHSPEDRDRYLAALTEFKKPALARRLLEFSLTDRLRAQDVWRPARALLANPPVQAEAWSFIRLHWKELVEKAGTVGAQRMIQGTRALWRPEWRREAEEFFGDPAHRVDAARRALAQSLEFADLGIRFKQLQQTDLSQWLKTRSVNERKPR